MTIVITHRGEAMRKFLMVAAVLAVSACGEKKTEATTDTMVVVTPPTATDSMGAMHDTMVAKHDSMVAKKDSMAPMAPKP